MEWATVIGLLVQNAPAAIKTAGDFIEWAKSTWHGVQDATGKPAAEVTAAELLAHIAQIKAQSGEIQSL